MARIVRPLGRSLALIASVVISVSGAAPVSAQSAADYRSLVNEYGTGDDSIAVAALAQWSRSAVADAARFWTSKLASRDLKAAVVLHTDLAFAIIDSAPQLARLHLEVAERDLRDLHDERGSAPRAHMFTPRWYEVVAGLYASRGLIGDADRIVRDGLNWFPRDPRLHVTRGSIREMQVTFDEPDLRGAAAVPRRLALQLDAAAADFRRALEIDNSLGVAHLHLGWVHFVQRDSRAERDLNAAAEGADESVRYLAHLFLGAVAERDGRLADAHREYEAASALGAGYQTPFIALSRVEEALGHDARARAIAQEYAGLARKADDPWWDYHLGGSNAATLLWLRNEAQFQ